MTTEEMIALKRKVRKKAFDNKNTFLKVKAKDKMRAILPILSSLISGREVDQDIVEKRINICSTCDYLALIKDKPACGICKCQLKIDDKSILNLASLEETDLYGCKHPDGSRWKKEGL